MIMKLKLMKLYLLDEVEYQDANSPESSPVRNMEKIGRDTKAQFFKLANAENVHHTKRRNQQRLFGLHSYNLLENPDFLQAKLIEKKLISYEQKKIQHQQSETPDVNQNQGVTIQLIKINR